jgi:hypothetical protein
MIYIQIETVFYPLTSIIRIALIEMLHLALGVARIILNKSTQGFVE